MPKLPANYVKAPSFDNPLRATAAEQERTLVLRLDQATWDALSAASERDAKSPEALVLRALERFLNEPVRAAMAPVEELPRRSLRTQLLEQLQEQFVQRSWVKCLLTLRLILRDVRQPQPT